MALLVKVRIADRKTASLLAAIEEGGTERLEGESDEDYVGRFMRDYLRQMVYQYDIGVAQRAVQRDDDALT